MCIACCGKKKKNDIFLIIDALSRGVPANLTTVLKLKLKHDTISYVKKHIKN